MNEKIKAFLQSKNIEVPNSNNEMANILFGSLIVGNIDYWLKRSFDFIDNETLEKAYEREWSEIAKQDKTYRTNFSQLNSDTKNQLKKLIRESLEGLIFSILSELNESDT